MSKPTQIAPQQPAVPSRATGGKTPLVVAAVAVAGVAVAAFALMGSDRAQPISPAPTATAASSTPAAIPEPPPDQTPAVLLKPHTQKDYPKLQLPGYALSRSPEVITAAYKFAAEHPEILSYVPCFCGCERSGHRGNEDCFVASRAPNGDVTAWEDHGMECAVCLDVAQQSMQMYASGASVRDIRAAVEKKWAAQLPAVHSHTPTPAPPSK